MSPYLRKKKLGWIILPVPPKKYWGDLLLVAPYVPNTITGNTHNTKVKHDVSARYLAISLKAVCAAWMVATTVS